MQDCKYVKKEEWQPVRDELYEIIHKLQDEVREYFTFQYHFVGSSKRNMITRGKNPNTGFDFDVNIEVNDPDEDYSAEEIRNILRNGLDRVTNHYGRSIFGYDYTEDSTRVLTIKVKDKANSRILHSCDFCVVKDCADGRQQYIHYNKKQQSYSWEYLMLWIARSTLQSVIPQNDSKSSLQAEIISLARRLGTSRTEAMKLNISW